jgi:hypothetical protein
MEQACYKCGQLVEEGRPFCPHCMAPQIRVLVAEPVMAPPSLAEPIAASQVSTRPASETVPVLAAPTGWSEAVKPAASAAVLGTILMVLGLYPIVAMLIMGFLGALFFWQGRPGCAMKPKIGIRLGALSGLFSSGFITLVTALGTLIPEIRNKFHEQTVEYIRSAATSQPNNPQLRVLLEHLKTPDGFFLVMVAFGVAYVTLAIVLSSLGGALAAAILGRRKRS